MPFFLHTMGLATVSSGSELSHFCLIWLTFHAPGLELTGVSLEADLSTWWSQPWKPLWDQSVFLHFRFWVTASTSCQPQSLFGRITGEISVELLGPVESRVHCTQEPHHCPGQLLRNSACSQANFLPGGFLLSLRRSCLCISETWVVLGGGLWDRKLSVSLVQVCSQEKPWASLGASTIIIPKVTLALALLGRISGCSLTLTTAFLGSFSLPCIGPIHIEQLLPSGWSFLWGSCSAAVTDANLPCSSMGSLFFLTFSLVTATSDPQIFGCPHEFWL